MKKQLQIILCAFSLVLSSSQSFATVTSNGEELIIPITDSEIKEFLPSGYYGLWKPMEEMLNKSNPGMLKQFITDKLSLLNREGCIVDLKAFCDTTSLSKSYFDAKRESNIRPWQNKHKAYSIHINKATPDSEELALAIIHVIYVCFIKNVLPEKFDIEKLDQTYRPNLSIRLTQHQDKTITVSSYPKTQDEAETITIEAQDDIAQILDQKENELLSPPQETTIQPIEIRNDTSSCPCICQ